jgi:hypothetical protein
MTKKKEPLRLLCAWPGCGEPALCASGNVCRTHFAITNGGPQLTGAEERTHVHRDGSKTVTRSAAGSLEEVFVRHIEAPARSQAAIDREDFQDRLAEAEATPSGRPGRPPGPIWMNPPYSNLKPWLSRAREAGLRIPVVCLIPADTSTRVRFHTPDGAGIHKTKGGGGSTIGPSAIVVYSPAGGPPRYTYILARLPAQASLLE